MSAWQYGQGTVSLMGSSPPHPRPLSPARRGGKRPPHPRPLSPEGRGEQEGSTEEAFHQATEAGQVADLMHRGAELGEVGQEPGEVAARPRQPPPRHAWSIVAKFPLDE